MEEQVRLKAADGHELDAYLSRPAVQPIAGLLLIQEAFGVNRHIRLIADEYARDGFLAIAPAMFDRLEREVELGYEGADREKGISLARRLNHEDAVRDLAAALAFLGTQVSGKCGVIGYCLGGTLAWLAATRLDPDAAVGYYGGQIPKYSSETPRCPVMLHFGLLDRHIPKPNIDSLQATHLDVQVFWYEADHGFNCNDRASYNSAAANLARRRSLEFLKKRLVFTK